jgi:small subunit ribosomal protein S1
MNSGTILEAKADMCTSNHDLILNLPCIKAVMPREEVCIGIKEGKTKDIAVISRVGKPVCFIVTGFEYI